MADFDVSIHWFDVESMKAFFGMSRQIGQRNLPIERGTNLFEKWIEAHGRSGTLEERATSGFIRKFLHAALSISNQQLIRIGSGRRREDCVDGHATTLCFSDCPI